MYADTRNFTHASNLHIHTEACVCVRLPETMKDKFSALKLRFGMNLTLFGSHSKPPFSQYQRPCMVPFQNTLKILRENLRFTRNNGSKREFFTKHPQVNILMIETFSSLDLWVLKFTIQFCLVVHRLTERNGQNQAWKVLCLRYWVLAFSFSFPCFNFVFNFFSHFVYVLICLGNLGFRSLLF